jgi:hypothetical protein
MSLMLGLFFSPLTFLLGGGGYRGFLARRGRGRGWFCYVGLSRDEEVGCWKCGRGAFRELLGGRGRVPARWRPCSRLRHFGGVLLPVLCQLISMWVWKRERGGGKKRRGDVQHTPSSTPAPRAADS